MRGDESVLRSFSPHPHLLFGEGGGGGSWPTTRKKEGPRAGGWLSSRTRARGPTLFFGLFLEKELKGGKGRESKSFESFCTLSGSIVQSSCYIDWGFLPA